MVMKLIQVLLLFALCSTADARLILDVVVIHKRGVDKSMVLQSELHSREEVFEDKKIRLNKSGLDIELTAFFKKNAGIVYGPPAEIQVEGAIMGPKGEVLKPITGEEGVIRLNEERKLLYKGDSDELIEITLKPYSL
jgi:hypothetical protein